MLRFTTRFNLVIAGQRVDAELARKLIIGLMCLVVVLIIALVSSSGGPTVVVRDAQAGPEAAGGESDLVAAGRYSDPGRFVAAAAPMTWAESNEYCISQGMTLASIHTRAEVVQAFYACAAGLTGSVGSGANSHVGDIGNCWIGLHDQPDVTGGTQGGFQWADGSPVDFLNWCEYIDIRHTTPWHRSRSETSFVAPGLQILVNQTEGSSARSTIA
jgi:hypothetical protein